MENTILYKNKAPIPNLLTEKNNKTRDSLLTRKSLKPFSSSVIPEKKRLPTREDLLKMNSKIQLIKSKCMNSPPGPLQRSESKKTMKSIWMNNDQLNDSVDIDS